MTPDIVIIRAALKATNNVRDRGRAYLEINQNAPTWLAALCDENEWLRAENAELRQSLEASET